MSFLRRTLRALHVRRRLREEPTQRLLLTHLSVLLVLCAVSTCALLVSYHEVHRTPDRVRDDMAPAIQEIAAARAALKEAQGAAEASVRRRLTDVAGAGEEYRTQLSAADQSLSRVAERQLEGDEGRGTLEAVNGLLTVYDDSVGQATGRYADDRLMRNQKLDEADSILGRPPVGILPRLGRLQDKQIATMRARTSFGATQTAGWVLTEVSLLLLATVLVSAWLTLRRRCGRVFNGWLLAGFVLTVLLAVLPLWWTVGTQHQLDRARGELTAMKDRASQPDLTAAGKSVRASMETTDPAAGRLPWIAGGCGVLVTLPLVGLGWRVYADYERAAP
ncbi:hypothetical protein HCC61_18335 [Streptomyces sp. HNM0575]|uniref:hypothetical protein n=1 Tax=Streptomyces sp. HNM0575 TaxID=2716338 RepID=UPI00145C80CD|nr:hypothetical protein [Streptomyces sp. HNM0575]NLU74610.1 hypothetical protein [Streptomyces sp. HNM0575]